MKEKECNCWQKDKCSKKKMACAECGKETKKLYPTHQNGCRGFYCCCKDCHDEIRDRRAQEDWKYHTALIGTDEIHCIKCSSEVSYKDITDGSESDVTITCPKCTFKFTLYHGEFPDEDPGEYEWEMQWKEWNKQIKEWKENGKKGRRPSSPEEEAMYDKIYRKYGEC